MNRCKVCGLPVLSCKKRRRLESPTLALCCETLRSLSCEVANMNVDYSSGYICLTCYRDVGKYAFLKSELQKLRDELMAKLTANLTAHCSQAAASIETAEQRHCVTKRRAPVAERPSVKVIVTHDGYEKRYVLSPRREEIGKSLARNSVRAFAKHAFVNKMTRKELLARVSTLVREDMKRILSDTTLKFEDVSLKVLTSYTWEGLYIQLTQLAPTLMGLLDTCVARCSPKRHSILLTCVAVLVKSHHRQTLIHILISLFLYSGHAAKQVYTRLQKMGICLSTDSTQKLLDTLGANHDSTVLEWVEELKHFMPMNQCVISSSCLAHMPTGTSSSSSSVLALSIFDDNSPPKFMSTPNSSFNGASDDEKCVSQSSCHQSDIPLLSDCDSSLSDVLDIAPDSGNQDVLLQEPRQEASQSESTTDDGDCVTESEWHGFKLVGDNIDKTVKPRDMRFNHQVQSLHYFHVYAVKDRINFSGLSNNSTFIDPKSIDCNLFYPSTDDDAALSFNMEILVARILTQNIHGLSHLKYAVMPHIQHKYTANMVQKSQVVPLGVLLKNENVIDDMVDIMDVLHKYVPKIRSTQTFDVCGQSGRLETVDVNIDHFHHILIGGDQLTTARIRGSQKVLSNSESGKERLEGLIPVIEDWHTKMTFMKVVWTRLYKTSSGLAGGTMYQLRNLINRRSVVSDVSKDMNSCEDFLELVTKAHIVAAAISLVGAEDVANLSENILSAGHTPSSQNPDHVLEYAKETLSLGLLYLEFKDAIREGDGERVLRC